MRREAERSLSPAMVLAAAGLLVAMAALVVALAGTATGLPGKNRIDRNDLRPRTVGPLAIRRNAIRSFQLAPKAVRGRHLVDGAIGPMYLSFGLDGGGAIETTPTQPQTNQYTTVITDTVRPLRPGIALSSATVEVQDDGQNPNPTLVDLRLLHNGTPFGPEFSATVADGEVETVVIGMIPRQVGGGTHTFSLQVRLSSAASIGDRSLGEIITPTMLPAV